MTHHDVEADVDVIDVEVMDDEEEASLIRRFFSEFVGTLLFVAIGTGAATVLAIGPLTRLGGVLEVFAGQPGGETQGDIFGPLLGAGAPTITELFPVAFAFAAGLAVLVYALGGVSGAHFNPAVTFALAVARRFSWKDVPVYWVAQCAGAIAGAFIIVGIYGDTGAAVGGADILYGATTVADNIDKFPAILAEAFIAFILMTAIMGVAVDPRAPKGWSGLIIGLSLAAGILVTGAATGGSANFARSLGPFVASMTKDVGTIPWGDLLVYAAGPLIGASAAALIYESVSGLERYSPAPSPGAATGSTELDDEEVEDTPFPPPDDGGPKWTTEGPSGPTV